MLFTPQRHSVLTTVVIISSFFTLAQAMEYLPLVPYSRPSLTVSARSSPCGAFPGRNYSDGNGIPQCFYDLACTPEKIYTPLPLKALCAQVLATEPKESSETSRNPDVHDICQTATYFDHLLTQTKQGLIEIACPNTTTYIPPTAHCHNNHDQYEQQEAFRKMVKALTLSPAQGNVRNYLDPTSNYKLFLIFLERTKQYQTERHTGMGKPHCEYYRQLLTRESLDKITPEDHVSYLNASFFRRFSHDSCLTTINTSLLLNHHTVIETLARLDELSTIDIDTLILYDTFATRLLLAHLNHFCRRDLETILQRLITFPRPRLLKLVIKKISDYGIKLDQETLSKSICGFIPQLACSIPSQEVGPRLQVAQLLILLLEQQETIFALDNADLKERLYTTRAKIQTKATVKRKALLSERKKKFAKRNKENKPQ